jgi:hypothetical protein
MDRGCGAGAGNGTAGRQREGRLVPLVTVLADPGGRLTHAEMEAQLTALSRVLVRLRRHRDSLDLRAAREPTTGSEQVRRGSSGAEFPLPRPGVLSRVLDIGGTAVVTCRRRRNRAAGAGVPPIMRAAACSFPESTIRVLRITF